MKNIDFAPDIGGGTNQGSLIVSSFEYPAVRGAPVPAWSGLGTLTSEGSIDDAKHERIDNGAENSAVNGSRDIERELQERFDAGRRAGLDEGRKAAQESLETRLKSDAARLSAEIAGIAQKFDTSLKTFLEDVESEVVGLALAIAAKILRRESQMDPLLLTGSVRVALGQLAKTTKVRLLVPQSEQPLWVEAMAHVPNLALSPEVGVGETLRTGDCVIETELGSVNLGIQAQLAEIERGLFDGISRRDDSVQLIPRNLRSTPSGKTA